MGAVDDRPDLSGVMLSVNTLNGGTWVFVIETQPGALETTGKNIVLDMVRSCDMPAIVASFGKKPPEDTGDRVIVKDSLLPRCKFLVGPKLGELSDDVSIYELLDSRNT